jgi:uridine phosphorylase
MRRFEGISGMKRYAESELILTGDNAVYHLNLRDEHIADDVILVGDPGRVAQVSSYFQEIEFRTQHREFITHTGSFNGKRITVISTGIGTDNIDIVLNELDAAVNINPVTRGDNEHKRRLRLYRLGTSGALQHDIPVNSLVTSTHGLGFDGLLNYYSAWEEQNENDISTAFMAHTQWPPRLPYPYCALGSEALLAKMRTGTFTGITATAPGFYGPQARELRLGSALPGLQQLLSTFSHEGLRITNFEMETSALYGLGRLLGHQCVTVCVIIANRLRNEFTRDYKESVHRLIENSLSRITDNND